MEGKHHHLKALLALPGCLFIPNASETRVRVDIKVSSELAGFGSNTAVHLASHTHSVLHLQSAARTPVHLLGISLLSVLCDAGKKPLVMKHYLRLQAR